MVAVESLCLPLIMSLVVPGVIPEECVNMSKLRDFKVDYNTDLKSKSNGCMANALSLPWRSPHFFLTQVTGVNPVSHVIAHRTWKCKSTKPFQSMGT